MHRDEFVDGWPRAHEGVPRRWRETGWTTDTPYEPPIDLLDLIQQEYCSKCRNDNGYLWAPILLDRYSVHCELDVLILRRGGIGSSISDGDLDNRVKTLIDCLKQPKGQEIVGQPTEQEKPFFCLLEDDKLVTRLEVQSDQLFKPRVYLPKEPDRDRKRASDDRLAHVVVTITLKPYIVNTFNLMFA
jgi:hypothetical protein